MNKTVALALGVLLVLYAPVFASGVVLSTLYYFMSNMMVDLGYAEQTGGGATRFPIEAFNPFQTTGPIYFAGAMIVLLVWALAAIGYSSLRLFRYGWVPTPRSEPLAPLPGEPDRGLSDWWPYQPAAGTARDETGRQVGSTQGASDGRG